MKPWWERLPKRLLEEDAALRSLREGSDPIVRTYQWAREASGEPRLRVDLILGSSSYELDIRFPTHYPEGCPSVRPVNYTKPKSEMVVRRFLDLEEHFTSATDDELETLFGEPAFSVTDMAAVKEIANTPMRRKLHGVLKSGRVLDSKKIQAVAKKIGASVQVAKGKLVVPTSLKEFRDFVRILDDAYLESMLDETTVYLTTSKRPVKPTGQ